MNLTEQEYNNLCRKTSGGFVPIDYYRKNFFNNTTRVCEELKRPKVIYTDNKITIKINRNLHQKHRDLLSILMYEKNTKPDLNGSYKIITNIYTIAKKMGYEKPEDNCHTVKRFLDDLRYTDVTTIYNGQTHQHMMLGESKYDSYTKNYEIEIPSKTSKYVIKTTCVQIPEKYNNMIVQLPNNLSTLKSLVSFLLSNGKLTNGIGFRKICDKLDITCKYKKSRVKRLIINNCETVFVISAENKEEYLDIAYGLGIKDFVKKPFTISELTHKITSYSKDILNSLDHIKIDNRSYYSLTTKKAYSSKDKAEILLNTKQSHILNLLIEKKDSFVSTEDIINKISEFETISENVVRKQVASLKNALFKTYSIVNKKGFGWSLKSYTKL